MTDNEKKKAEEDNKQVGEEGTKEVEDTGDKYETTPLIELARSEREKLEAATKAQREENDRTERIQSKQALGGITEAGQSKPEVSENQKKINDAEEYFEGTQLAIDIRKANE